MSFIENSTPKTYTIKVQGYGGEIVLGKVSNHIYEYFRNHEVDLADFAYDAADTQIIDRSLHPVHPGAWFDCDGIAHEIGAEMDETSYIEVIDQDGSIVWASPLDAAILEEVGCEVITAEDIYASDQKEGSVVFYGQQFEQGLFFEGTLELTETFNPEKLKFLCTDIEGWSICNGIEYDNQYIDGYEYAAEEQNTHFAFIKILENGDTESYTGPDDNDYDVEETCL